MRPGTQALLALLLGSGLAQRDAFPTENRSCKATFSNAVFALVIDAKCLSDGSHAAEACPVDSADDFLDHYGSHLKVLEQITTFLATVAQACLIYAGAVPDRRRSKAGCFLWALWLAIQVSACMLYLLSAWTAVLSYWVASARFSQCFARVGGAPLLHLVAVPLAAAHPSLGVRLVALLVCIECIIHGAQWSTTTETVRKVAAVCSLPLLIGFIVADVYFVLTLSVLFSAIFLPILLTVALCAAVSLGGTLLITSYVQKGEVLLVWRHSLVPIAFVALVLGPWAWTSSLFAFLCYAGNGSTFNWEAAGALYAYVFGDAGIKVPDCLDFGALRSMGAARALEALAAARDPAAHEPSELLKASRLFFAWSSVLSLLKAAVLCGNGALLLATRGRLGAPAASAARERAVRAAGPS